MIQIGRVYCPSNQQDGPLLQSYTLYGRCIGAAVEIYGNSCNQADALRQDLSAWPPLQILVVSKLEVMFETVFEIVDAKVRKMASEKLLGS